MLPVSLMPMHQQEQEWNNRMLSSEVAQPRIKIWTYDVPAVVLGCSQKKMMNSEEVMQGTGIETITRSSGGGAVLVGPWLIGVSVALPVDHTFVQNGPTSTYQWLGECHIDVLKKMGLGVRLIKPDSVKDSIIENDFTGVDWACFGSLSPWEVITNNGQKIVGMAQIRRRTGILLVSGLLITKPKWELLCRTLNKPEADINKLDSITTSCKDEMGKCVADNEVSDLLSSCITNRLNNKLDVSRESCQPNSLSEDLVS
jgi:lipoate---protein ligase